MIDLVYPLRWNGSRADDRELRYSLRSIQRFLDLPLGKLVIVGYRPKWLTEESVIIPQDDRQDKAVNLRVKYGLMCKSAEISDPFLLLDDDHIFLQPASAIPLVSKGSLWHLVRKYIATQHGRYLQACLDVLNQLALPSKNYQIHYPMLIDKSVLSRCVELMRRPMVMGSLYGNLAGGGVEVAGDYRFNTNEEFLSRIEGPFISLPPISTPAVWKFLGERFPEASRWEKAEVAAA